MYTFESGLFAFIPVATLVFVVWKTLRGSGRLHWTVVFPYLTVCFLGYLDVASGLDWNFKNITFDDYLMGMCATPLFGMLVQILYYFLFIRRKRKATL